jgi:hypothetical protein
VAAAHGAITDRAAVFPDSKPSATIGAREQPSPSRSRAALADGGMSFPCLRGTVIGYLLLVLTNELNADIDRLATCASIEARGHENRLDDWIVKA